MIYSGDWVVTKVIRIVGLFAFSIIVSNSSALAEDANSPQMAKPFLQKNRIRRKVTATPAPARRATPVPSATMEPTAEPKVEATASPEPVQTPQPQVRRATPAPRSRPASRTSSNSGGAIDLSTLTTSDSGSSSGSSMRGGSTARSSMRTPHQSSGIAPNFKFYFDFLFKYSPGVDSQSTYGFDSFHQVMMVEFIASPELMFMTEFSAVNSTPRFFELDYQFSPKVTLRWGKIWIPFDDMAPHNIFGGRINTSRLFENTADRPFLPDLWAELGVGAKILLTENTAVATELHLYVTNGFGSGGTDPTGSGTSYPDFQTATIKADNNNDKSYGARLHGKFFQRASLGFSAYRGTWTDKGTPNKGITLLGFDTQIRPTNAFEIRSGLIMGTVGLNPPSAKESYSKGGAYVEGGLKFGENQTSKFLVRGGVVQNDSRVRDNSDRKIVGATILKRFGPLEASLQYSRDLQRFPGKDFYQFGAFRVVAAF